MMTTESRTANIGMLIILSSAIMALMIYNNIGINVFPFIAAFTIAFVIPGAAIARGFRIKAPPLDMLMFSSVFGMIATGFIYAVLLWLGAAPWLWLWMIICAVVVLRHIRSTWAGVTLGLNRLDRGHVILLAVIGACIAMLADVPIYYENLSVLPTGAISHFNVADVSLHLSITQELTHTFPPQVPFFSGKILSYHIGMDIVPAIINYYFHIPITDLVSRFFSTVFPIVNCISAYCLGRRITGSSGGGALSAFLVMLGEDLAFIPGLLHPNTRFWWSDFWHVHLISCFFDFNPYVFSIGIFLTALLLFHMADKSVTRTENIRLSAAGVLCTVALIQIKIFVFIQFALAIAVTAAIFALLFKKLDWIVRGIGILVLSLPLLAQIALENKAGGHIDWVWSPWVGRIVAHALTSIGLGTASIPFPLALAGLLILILGLRLTGLPPLCRAMIPTRQTQFEFLLAVFIVIGPFLTWGSTIESHDYPHGYNNSIWFLVSSKCLMSLFAARTILPLLRRSRPRTQSLLVGTILLLSLPTTLAFAVAIRRVEHGQVAIWSPAMVDTAAFLARTAPPGDVVLTDFPRDDDPIPLLTPLRVPFEDLFVHSIASAAEIQQRKDDLKSFWQTLRAGSFQPEVLRRYGCAWLVADPRTASAGLAQGVQSGILQPAHTNPDLVVYRIVPD